MSEKSILIDRLSNNNETRQAYIRSKVSTNIASQIRALRRRGGLTQTELAKLSEMKQSRISATERPGTRLNIETLVRLAAAFKTGLSVRFVSFSEMLGWENQFSQDEFDVINVDEDLEFRRPESVTSLDATLATESRPLSALSVISSLGLNSGPEKEGAPGSLDGGDFWRQKESSSALAKSA
jgi:transcriptional regulator with XRE-family HTH domain